MANDDTQKTLTSMLAEVVAANTPSQPAERLLNDLVPYLSLQGSTNAVSDQSVQSLVGPLTGETELSDGRIEIATGLAEPMTQLNRQLAELTIATRMQSESSESNTQAVIENSLAKSSGDGKSTAGSIGKTVLSFLGSGLGIVQLFGKLFGGKKDESIETSLSSYVLPEPVGLEAGLAGLGIQPIRYGQDGLPRPLPSNTISQPTPITIQVQAIDSRSFMDHSAEIAGAVKEAMLNTHSLNDVIAEL